VFLHWRQARTVDLGVARPGGAALVADGELIDERGAGPWIYMLNEITIDEYVPSGPPATNESATGGGYLSFRWVHQRSR
jgi:hypothetical protein